MKKLKILGIAIISSLMLSSVGVVVAERWDVMLSNQKFVVDGKSVKTNQVNSSDASDVLFGAGSAHLLIYRAKVIEMKTDHSLIVEILPRITKGEEYSVTERVGEDKLITGDIVEAVYRSDNDRAAEFISLIGVGDIVNIAYFKRVLSFDFSNTPIVVDCDSIDIYDIDGQVIKQYF